MLHIIILINKNFINLLDLFVDLFPKMIIRMLDIFKGWLDVDNCIWDNKIMAFLCFCLCQSRYVVRSPPKSCYHFFTTLHQYLVPACMLTSFGQAMTVSLVPLS